MSTKAPSALHTDTSFHPSLSCIADFSYSTCCYADAPSRTHIYNALLTTSPHITEVAILILLHLVLFSMLVLIYGIGPLLLIHSFTLLTQPLLHYFLLHWLLISWRCQWHKLGNGLEHSSLMKAFICHNQICQISMKFALDRVVEQTPI